MSRSRPADWRQGAQLVAAVLLSHAVATVFALPEAFWSVMSVLIVMRGDTGATLAECASVLKRVGVPRVDVWALARAPLRRE